MSPPTHLPLMEPLTEPVTPCLAACPEGFSSKRPHPPSGASRLSQGPGRSLQSPGR
jgi:hypothetical protein